MEDSQIIELYWQRSENAIAETAKKYGKLCRHIAMNIVGNFSDAEECEKLSAFLLDQILKFDDHLIGLKGDIYVSSDTVIADVQNWYVNRLNAIQGQLEHTAAGYTIKASIPIAAAIGAIAGVCAAVTGLFFVYLMKDKTMKTLNEKER